MVTREGRSFEWVPERCWFCNKFRMVQEALLFESYYPTDTMMLAVSSGGKRHHMELWQAPVGISQCRAMGFWNKAITSNRDLYSLWETVLDMLMSLSRNGIHDHKTKYDHMPTAAIISCIPLDLETTVLGLLSSSSSS